MCVSLYMQNSGRSDETTIGGRGVSSQYHWFDITNNYFIGIQIIFYIKYNNFNEFILCIQLNNRWIEASRELNLFTPVLNICLASCQLTVWMGTWRRWKVVRLSVKKSRPIWRSLRPLSLTLVDQTTRRNQRKNCLKWRGS